jgi:ABC-type lipoprotein release transport system permease subunit
MGAVRLVFGARWRGHWRAWLLLALLVALVSGLVMAATAAGRRTDQAFPRYLARHGYDTILYTVTPRPRLRQVPEVTAAVPVALPFDGPASCTCHSRLVTGNAFTVREVPPAELSRVAKLVAGRMPDQAAAGEALASFTLARDARVRVGTRIRLPLYAPSQRAAAFAALAGGRPPRARGPVITVTIVGIAASEAEFPSGQAPVYDVYTTGAFAAASRGTPALQTYYVRLHGGQAASPRFEAGLVAKGTGVEDLDHPAAAVAASIRPQAVGWWILAGLTALAGLAVLAQALARQALTEDGDFPVLTTLGLRPRDLAALGLLRTAVVAVAGAAAGVAVAVALSPVAPLGEARLADPDPGLRADGLVLGAGAPATVLLVLALGAVVAGRQAWPRAARDAVSRPSAVVRAAVAAGAPATTVIGLRHALTRTPGTRALPVATALTGAVAAVAALAATAVFGASLTHLTRSPELYGAPFQRYVMSSGPGGAPPRLLAELNRDPAISQVTTITLPAVTVNRVSVRAVTATAVRGPTLLSAVRGRLPRGPGEVALGVSTLRRAGGRLGSPVTVTVSDPGGTQRSARFRVVGLVAFPGDLSTGGLGTGVALTTGGYLAAACPPGPGQAACRRSVVRSEQSAVLVRAAPGARGAGTLTRLGRQYQGDTYRPQVPAALVNFGESANFPLMLGAVLVLCGVAALAYLLIASVARRRQESALLKALGFVRRQTAAVVFWQASAVAVIGVVIGLPLGAAVGQAVWRVFAFDLGMVVVPVVPAAELAVLAAGVLVAANALAVIPAVAAARSRTGPALRAE